jgi:molecular chaperone GrpE (heat shock protein)
MAVVNKPTEPNATNGDAELQRLEALVANLRAECDNLREALAKVESERESYRQLFLTEARERREFANVDYDDLIRTSAGPVEKL